MRSPLFEQANREQETGQRWTVQSSKMLRVALGPEVLAAQGAMVAYQGNLDFSYQGSRSLGGMIKKAATGEGGNLMRVSGQGEVFFARSAQNVFLLQLEGDAITVNTPSLLAFDAHLGYDIRMLGNAGILAGGLFNLVVQGQGVVAVSSDGPPLLLDCSQQPTFVDPQAAICWSANLQPQIKSTFKMGSLIGRGSGESFQLAFHGPGFVVVQPSEGQPLMNSASANDRRRAEALGYQTPLPKQALNNSVHGTSQSHRHHRRRAGVNTHLQRRCTRLHNPDGTYSREARPTPGLQ